VKYVFSIKIARMYVIIFKFLNCTLNDIMGCDLCTETKMIIQVEAFSNKLGNIYFVTFICFYLRTLIFTNMLIY